MNHRYKSIFRSHHWPAIVGVAAVTIGATGLMAPESNSSIPDPHRNVNVVSPSSGRSTLAAFSTGYEEENRPAIRLTLVPTSTTPTQKPAFSFSKASAHASHHKSKPNSLVFQANRPQFLVTYDNTECSAHYWALEMYTNHFTLDVI